MKRKIEGKDQEVGLERWGVCSGEGRKREIVRCLWGGQRDVYDEVIETVSNGESVRIIVVYYVWGDIKCNLDYRLKLQGKNAYGEIFVCGVVAERAQKDLRMRIDLEPGCEAAVGKEREDVLILFDDVKNVTRPEMWCGTERARGEHGVTVGRLDERQMEYLQTRGVPKGRAKTILMRAKLWQVLKEISNERIREAVKRRLSKIELERTYEYDR